jgi:PAS domain S-box-containing protein
MKKLSLKKNLLTPLSLALGILLVAFIFNVYRSSLNEISLDVGRELDSVDKLFNKQIYTESELIGAFIEMLKDDPQIQNAWLAKNRSKLLELCAPILKDIRSKLRITHFYFHDTNRVNFLRVYNPTRYGDIISRTSLLNAEKSGRRSFGVELGKLGTVTIRVVHPWLINNQLTGYIEMGVEIDEIVEKLHDILGVELYVAVYKEYLTRDNWEKGMAILGRKGNWDQFPSSVIIDHTKEEIPKEFSDYLVKGKHEYMEMDADLQLQIESKYYRVGVIPVYDIASREIGDIVMLYDVTSKLATLKETVLITGFLCLVIGIGLFILFSKFLDTIEAQLNKYRHHLEELVQERTEELMETNILLEDEIKGHRATEVALKESEKRYRSFVQEFKGIAFRNNIANSIPIFFHGAVEELAGYTEDDFASGAIKWEGIIHPDDYSKTRYTQKVITEPDFTFKGEYRIICKDGSVKWVFENSYNICDVHGKPVFLEGTLHDITNRKKMEEELQKVHKLESLGLLAGGIAHDFNNLLTGILGNISLCKVKSEPGSKIFEILSRAEKATQRAGALTQQLLTFSKGGEPIRMSTNIIELLKDSTTFVLSGSKVLVTYDIQKDLWPVDADRGQISQVFQNLTLNALEAMHDGGILQIYASNEHIGEKNNQTLKPGKYIKLIFADKGTGIKKDNLDKIFDPYFTTKKTGNGLGLSATYSIISKHHGFIEVDSEPGTGTRISIYLPTSEKSPSNEILIDEKILPGKGRILIMDDEESIRDVIKESLTGIGYQVDVTENGDETIQYYLEAIKKNLPYDAVILDLTIPGGKGGKETMQEIHKINPTAKVIVSSGYSQDPIMADYKKYGFVGVIPKPYNIYELNSVLYEIIP